MALWKKCCIFWCAVVPGIVIIAIGIAIAVIYRGNFSRHACTHVRSRARTLVLAHGQMQHVQRLARCAG
jgi:hypothetical protein